MVPIRAQVLGDSSAKQIARKPFIVAARFNVAEPVLVVCPQPPGLQQFVAVVLGQLPQLLELILISPEVFGESFKKYIARHPFVFPARLGVAEPVFGLPAQPLALQQFEAVGLGELPEFQEGLC